MDVAYEFIVRLKAEMAAKDMNPASLSLAAGLNRRAVTDLLEGRAKSPKLSTAYALASALGTTLDALCGLAPQASISPKLLEFLGQYDEEAQEQLVVAISALPKTPPK